MEHIEGEPVDTEVEDVEIEPVAGQDNDVEDSEEVEETDEDETEDLEGDDDDETGDDDRDDEGLGQRAQKRIQKLIAEKKEAQAKFDAVQKELEAAKKLSGDDGKAMLRAAETSGILPGLMSRDEAEAFEELETLPRRIENYEDWLDDHESHDTLMMGETEMTYGDVKKRLRKLRGQYEDLKAEYGERRKELKAKVREIFETGVAALKAGWKPGEKVKTEKKKIETRPKANSPKPKREGGGSYEDMDVSNDADLEEYFARRRRK